MSKLQVNDIVNKDDDGSVGFSKGAVVTGVTTTTTLAVTGIATAATLKVGSAITAFGGIVTATTFSGDITGDVTGNINASSAAGISTVGVLTAYSSIHINVGSGSTEVATELSNKTSPCLLYTSPSPRDISGSRMPSSA